MGPSLGLTVSGRGFYRSRQGGVFYKLSARTERALIAEIRVLEAAEGLFPGRRAPDVAGLPLGQPNR
jgi:hypothetical protein